MVADAARQGQALRIIARLPFIDGTNSRSADRPALVVGAVLPEPTSEDCSYLAVTLADDLSRGAFKTALADAGFVVTRFCARSRTQEGLHLVEVEGFVAADDPRLAAALDDQGDGIRAIALCGSYATPLVLPTTTAEAAA